MELQLERKQTESLEKTPVLQQTAFWSEIKRKQGISSGAFKIKIKTNEICHTQNHKYIQDDFLVLFQDIGDGRKVGYVPYGPTIEPAEDMQGLFLEELSESLRPFLNSKSVMLRYDLSWESPWAKDSSCYIDGNWLGPPAKQNQELRINFNTYNWNLKKANTNILPKDTLFIDLRKDEIRLLKDMKRKTRYNIRLSQRKGVKVRKAGMNDISLWYELYKETCVRNGMYLDEQDYFENVFSTNAGFTNSPAKVDLLIAELDDAPLAAMFLVCSGRRATYLYGASTSAYRQCMASYALQWEAIKRAKKIGCTEYDMFGIAPNPDPAHPMYGLYRFKTGFGGKIFHRMGCWDYPLSQQSYELYLSKEMNSKGFLQP